MSVLALGATFRSHDDLCEAVRNYENENGAKLFKRSSKTIEAAKKTGLKKNVNSELKYIELILACIYAGNDRSRSTGQRKSSFRTFHRQCPFRIKISTCEDGNFLIVKRISGVHNHDGVDKPPAGKKKRKKQHAYRCPTSEIAKQVLIINANGNLESSANKKLEDSASDNLDSSTSEILASEQIISAVTLIERVGGKCPDSLQSVISMLQENELGTVVILQDNENELLGVFYQDIEMKKSFSAYPEVIMVDSFYKSSDLIMKLYILMVENGNGDFEIVAFFLLICQEVSTLTAVASVFKSHNPSWRKVQCILSDKHFVEINAFAEEFPLASHVISFFHAMRTFNMEICMEKLGITSGQRNACLIFIERLILSKNEDEYMHTLNILEETAPRSVLEHFHENWHQIRGQWVTGLQQKQGHTRGDRTNNHLEVIHQNVAQIVTKYSRMDNLFQGLMEFIARLRAEKESKTSNLMKSYESVMQYLKVLTPYAFSLVMEQFGLKDSVVVLEDSNVGTLVQSSEGNLEVSSNKCHCSFFTNLSLPCRHIFKVRENKCIDIFSENLIPTRWTKAYFLSRVENNGSQKTDIIVHTVIAQSTLSQCEKHRCALNVCENLASLVSEVPNKQFSQRLSMLETLIQVWQLNKEV